jgi:tetracycline repressor-like protein
MPLVGTMPAIGPNAMRLMSRLIDTFAQAGFQNFEQDYAASTLMSYVAGATTPEIAMQTMLARSGVSVSEWSATMRPTVEKAAADHPDLLTRYVGYSDMDVNASRALSFDFGLSCILDGLETRLNLRPRPAVPPSQSHEGVHRSGHAVTD